MNSSRISARRAAICAAVAALSFATVVSTANAAKLSVSYPDAGDQVSGEVAVRAELKSSQKIRSAQFYVRGKKVGKADTHKPFRSPKYATADLTGRSPGKATINIKVKYKARSSSGKWLNKSLSKSISVRVIAPAPPPPSLTDVLNREWHVIFNDEFDSQNASLQKWLPFRWDWIKGGSPYNNFEGAGYRPQNASVSSGMLHIKISDTPAGGLPFSTGSVSTNHRFKFRYGYLEARIRIPKCDGCWPAFWMLPDGDTWPPEIDIFEFFDTLKEPWPVTSLHRPANDADLQEYTSLPMSGAYQGDYTNDWHTYQMYWAPDRVRVAIDNVPGALFTDTALVPDVDMYPILQLAVIKGHRPPTGTTMQVDYVRAWQHN